jgi:pyruvate/2-oxoglutarate dehydrogenase complex dihydrolipoamide acyltransferase (E2) component
MAEDRRRQLAQSGYSLGKAWFGAPENKAATPPAEDKTQDLSALTVAELGDLAAERGVEVEGTGKDGNVLKADYLKALA